MTNFTPTKRHAIVCVYRETFTTSIAVDAYPPTCTAKFGTVTSVTRQGAAKRVEFPDGTAWTKRDWDECLTMPARVDEAGLKAAMANNFTFTSMEDARAFARPFAPPSMQA